MKVTFVYAGITGCGFNSQKDSEGSWINHGLAILSSVAKQAGHKVTLLDLRRMKGWNEFRTRVSEMNSSVFGLTMMSVDYNNAVKAATIIRNECKNAKIVVGGPHPSICPEELVPLECFDYIFRGEGEITFPKLLSTIEHGKTMPRVLQGKSLENLDDAPWSDRSLFSIPEEPFVPFLKPPFVTIIAGRGCKYNCNYCQPAERIMFGHKVRRRSAENVIAELKDLRNKFQFNSFMIHDDCITEDRKWVLQFLQRLKEEGLTQPFVAQSRADIICRNPDMVKVLFEAGLRLMIIGFESGSDRMLRYLRKGCTRTQNLEAARICRDLNIKIWANYMLGLPTETKDEVWETYSMLKEIKPYHCSPALYTPHPGSDLYQMGKEMGIHLITNHDSYRRNTYDAKIKGPDYKFLQEIYYRSFALAQDMNTPAPRRPQMGLSWCLPSLWSRWRNVIRGKIMRLSPKLYHSLKRIKRIKT
jgi:radical SAM superfamily enzyme YgiQ (UPF0313 family)